MLLDAAAASSPLEVAAQYGVLGLAVLVCLYAIKVLDAKNTKLQEQIAALQEARVNDQKEQAKTLLALANKVGDQVDTLSQLYDRALAGTGNGAGPGRAPR